jgi:cation/acetate symporter
MIILMRAHVALAEFGITEPVFDSFLGINAQGIGLIGMILNFIVTYIVTMSTPPPPQEVQDLVEQIRYPRTLTKDELSEAASS